MFQSIFTHVVCIIICVSYINGFESGSGCKINGVAGECLPARECLSAKENYIKNRKLPIICSYQEEVRVCCANDTTPEAPTTTTRRSTDGCEPLTSVAAPEIGQKSWNKCLEYHEKIIRPCVDIILVEGKFRNSRCSRESLALIVQNEVLENEFPHMVLLGYGDNITSLQWLSEGVIISERFILTLAAVTSHYEYGSVKYVRTGALNISEPVDDSRLFKIKRIIRHPLYKPPNPYNDIALLEIDNEIPLDLSAMPACVDVGNLPSYAHALALGWSASDRTNSMLQKGHFFEAASSDACVISGDRYTYDKAIQICYNNNYDKVYGHGFQHVLQIEHLKCMDVVIGLSFRPFNNNAGRPFTRVAAFVPWIESIVWPESLK